MKQRSTTPVSKKGMVTRSLLVAAAVTMAVAAPLSIYNATSVYARDYDAEINAIQQQINQYEGQAQKLADQANTLQNQLAILAQQKQVIQSEIDLAQAKYEKLKSDIIATEKKIKENQDLLGKIIADIYTDDNISPLEMLASAKDISDFLDKQEYRSSVSSSLEDTIAKVKQLKKDLEQQKVDVERVLADQNNAKKALVAKENEQSTLLAQTKNDESAYKKLSADAQAQKLQVMQAQQAAINAAMARAGGGGLIQGGVNGSYESWAGECYVDANAWSHGGARGNGEDPLGYGCNQCVSYTAWKMLQVTGYGPSYWGNANMWPGSARAAGFHVTSTPRERAIGVISAGQYGHVVYIESYNQAAGTVNISQYNEWLPGRGWGHFSTRQNVPAGTYDTYIYL